jgi:excinuclease ABC subunit A
MRQSVDKAMEQGDGLLMIANTEGKTRYLSRSLMCPTTGLAYRDPAPHTFSFNSPSGWCECCKGLGRVRSSSVSPTPTNQDVEDIIQQDDWFEKLRQLSGIELEEDTDETQTEWTVCPECEGKRLSKESLSYKIGPYTIHDMSSMDIDVLLETLQTISPQLTERQQAIAAPILKEICGRLRFMQAVGLSYLSLGRPSDSLSGGESQRIRLATQIGSRLVNVLYILDEPSIGLHQRDNQRLISSLKELRDLGNSVIVVEHDEQIMREADWIIDIGPKAGRLGGKVLFSGTPEEMLKTDTLTAQYLRGELSAVSHQPSDASGHTGASGHSDKLPLEEQKWLTLSGCTGNNLQDVTVRIPLGQMVGVTGVSGSGKSTLINQTLYPILSQHFYRSLKKPLAYRKIEGLEHIDKVINVDQSPIGRSPRSNPATYTNVFNDIRDLFAQMPESRMRGWKPGRFSFNMRGGRCEECKGNGFKTIQMHFMPDVFVPCEACNGRRYNKETLEVRFKGKSIGEILDMTVNQAVEFFENQPTILRKIKTIQDVGLGYIKLGQPSTTLSGGESQRIKLATELSRPSTGRTLYILDEPTTGLHFEDIRVLNGVLRQLVDRGNTVVVIEHNLDVIRACDWLIDLGPEGGRGGGRIVAEGRPQDVKQSKDSITGKFL